MTNENSKNQLEFYDELREQITDLIDTDLVRAMPFFGVEDPSYIGRNLHNVDFSDGKELTLCHIPIMLRYSNKGKPLSGAEAYASSVGAMLAMHHFNTGNGAVVKELNRINERCNVRLTTEIIDTRSSPFDALRNLNRLLVRDPFNITHPQPCALFGSQLSAVTAKLASMSGLFDLPQVTSAAMSADLDNPSEYPTLARTHSDVIGYGEMSTSYIYNQLGISNCGLLVPNDSYGLSFQKAVFESRAAQHMNIKAAQYIPVNDEKSRAENEQDIRKALAILKETGFHYFIGAFHPETYGLAMGIAYEMGLAGPSFFWLTTGPSTTAPFVTGSRFVIETESNAAKAIAGNGLISCKGGLPGMEGSYKSFSKEWALIGSNPNALAYMNSKQPKIDNSTSFAQSSSYFNDDPHHIVTFSYDAVVGLGLSACNVTDKALYRGNIFSGKDHRNAFANEHFRGASGDMIYRPNFPTRDPSSSFFVMTNLALNSMNSTHSSFVGSKTPHYFNTGDVLWENYGNFEFMFSDGSLNKPAELTKMEEFSNSTNSTSITVPVILFVLGLLTIGLMYRIKKKKVESTWAVDPSELVFTDPPVVLGRGTFGLVILAEYRGTQVAVKRVSPPNEKRKTNSTASMQSSLHLSGMRSSDAKPVMKRRSSLTMKMSGASESHVVKVAEETETELQQRRLSDILETFSFEDEDNENEPDADVENGLKCVAAPAEFQSTLSCQSNSKDITRYWTKSPLQWFTSMAQGNSTSLGASASSMSVREEFINEMRLLSRLRHPCITTVMGAVIAKGKEPLLIMEYMDYGSLYDLLHNETMAIDGDFVLPVLKDICQGLHFLHAAEPTIIHGDLKAANVLVDIKLRAKVADFGLSQKKKLSTGTPLWMAPELLQRTSPNTTASDVYSFGIILYEVYSRKDPYEGEGDLKMILNEICDPYINRRPNVPGNMPNSISSLMAKCLYRDPESRPSIQEISKELKSFDEKNIAPMKSAMQIKNESTRDSKLLYDMLPKHIADSLREGKKIEPETHECVTIFFSDIVGFTTISSSMSPLKVSNMLDRLYQQMDALADKHGIFKVETIGDAWMGVTNLISHQSDHALRIAKFSIDAISAASKTHVDLEDPGKGFVQIRVGFHSGSVVTNVIGTRNPRFSLFGDTVNTASRMESNSQPGRIHCSNSSADLLMPFKSEITISPRGSIHIKGKGEMNTFWIAEPNKDDSFF